MPHYVVFLCLASACQLETKKSFLPPAKGQPGEVMVFMDSAYWAGSVGQALRSVLMEAQPTPQPEPLFSLKYVNALQWPQLLKEHRNLIFTFTFERGSAQSTKIKRLFTPDALKKIQTDTALSLTVRKDLFAKGQKAVFIFSKNSKTLAKWISDKRQYLQNLYTKSERQFVLRNIRSAKQNKELIKIVQESFGVQLTIPQGFQLVQDTAVAGEQFLWMRHPEVAFDLNIFIAKKPYTSQSAFDSTQIIARRDQLAKQYLYGNPNNKDSFIMTEQLVPPEFKRITVQKQYCIRIEGLWRTHNISMGGPFIAYTLLNPAKDHLYYLEGFVYAPSMRKRELLRKLATIISNLAFVEWSLKR